ncbi:hypothetical protein Trydic_g13183 [Trypoxylus dichotomus]
MLTFQYLLQRRMRMESTVTLWFVTVFPVSLLQCGLALRCNEKFVPPDFTLRIRIFLAIVKFCDIIELIVDLFGRCSVRMTLSASQKMVSMTLCDDGTPLNFCRRGESVR